MGSINFVSDSHCKIYDSNRCHLHIKRSVANFSTLLFEIFLSTYTLVCAYLLSFSLDWVSSSISDSDIFVPYHICSCIKPSAIYCIDDGVLCIWSQILMRRLASEKIWFEALLLVYRHKSERIKPFCFGPDLFEDSSYANVLEARIRLFIV